MNNVLRIIIVTLLASTVSCDQGPKGLLEMNAIVIENPREISKRAFNQLVVYDAIVIDELHETNECADLAYGLAKIFTANDERVLVGHIDLGSLMGLGHDDCIRDTPRKSQSILARLLARGNKVHHSFSLQQA